VTLNTINQLYVCRTQLRLRYNPATCSNYLTSHRWALYKTVKEMKVTAAIDTVSGLRF